MPTSFDLGMDLRENQVAGAPATSALFRENFSSHLINADNAIGATGVITAMLVPVRPGDVITKASVCVGATAGATLTHKYFALYSNIAVPALIGTQQTDDTGATMAANTVYTGTFGATFTVPAGTYSLWVALCITGTTIPTLVGKPSGVNATTRGALNTLLAGTVTNGICATATGAASTAPATMASITQLAVQPWVLLQ